MEWIEQHVNSVMFTFKVLFLNFDHTGRFFTTPFNSAVNVLMVTCT